MKLNDFAERYYFHDSYPQKIEFDSIKKTLTITIHFCNWMQDYYQSSMEELILVDLIFHDVKLFECNNPEKFDWKYTIFKTETIVNPLYDNGIEFVLFHDDSGEMSVIRIFAQDVEFVELGPNND
ncbi:MAG: hypothetical protein IJQ39_00445 [Thermoguttaceae bacterium]|nr:hypothetical protein [Thermoguttaceae bacterium]